MSEDRTLDNYDRALGSLQGSASSGPTTIELVTYLTGQAETFIVRTFRRLVPLDGKEEQTRAEFTTFLQHYRTGEPGERIVLPMRVVDLMFRQRDTLITQARRQAGKARMKARMANGWRPNFGKRRSTKK